jgi:hypothetical protein
MGSSTCRTVAVPFAVWVPSKARDKIRAVARAMAEQDGKLRRKKG